jgi:hypothetical protein
VAARRVFPSLPARNERERAGERGPIPKRNSSFPDFLLLRREDWENGPHAKPVHGADAQC